MFLSSAGLESGAAWTINLFYQIVIHTLLPDKLNSPTKVKYAGQMELVNMISHQ